jgi:subtilisin family serine protease
MGQMCLPARRLLLAVVGCLVALVATPAGADLPADDVVFQQGLQWSLERIGAPEAWARATGQGVTIAVVDSGVDLGHEDLAGQVVGSVSCVGAGTSGTCQGSAQDDNGHGTHVAGIALASTGNGIGIAGVAPDADLLAVRVLTNECTASGCTATGTSADVSAGIRWAVEHGADVVNLSLGAGAMQSAMGCSFCDAVEYAWSRDVIVVVAAGNDSVLPAGFGDEPAVVVTATTRDDARASYSNASSGLFRAARWPLAAPGGEAETDPDDCATDGTPKGVISTYWSSSTPGSDYACLAGTSMAAPHVSGALALLLSLGYDPDAAIGRLIDTATDLGAAGRDSSFGYGRIDLAAAAGTAGGASGSSTSGPASGPSSTVTEATPTTTPTSVPAAATAPPPTVAAGPVVSTPEISAAAPFSAKPPGDDGPPPWLLATAVGALLASGAVTARGAWRIAQQASPTA